MRIRSAKDFFAFAEEVNKLDYQLIPEMQEMVDEYKEETKKRMTAEEKQKIAEKLLAQKARGYQVYLQKTSKIEKNKRTINPKKK